MPNRPSAEGREAHGGAADDKAEFAGTSPITEGAQASPHLARTKDFPKRSNCQMRVSGVPSAPSGQVIRGWRGVTNQTCALSSGRG